jgi:hypothetical protein
MYTVRTTLSGILNSLFVSTINGQIFTSIPCTKIFVIYNSPKCTSLVLNPWRSICINFIVKMFALNFLSYTTVKNQLSWNALTPTHKTLSLYGRKYPELIGSQFTWKNHFYLQLMLKCQGYNLNGQLQYNNINCIKIYWNQSLFGSYIRQIMKFQLPVQTSWRLHTSCQYRLSNIHIKVLCYAF